MTGRRLLQIELQRDLVTFDSGGLVATRGLKPAEGLVQLLTKQPLAECVGADKRCTVFGKPERPLICKYYDAWRCTYKVNFGSPRPEDYLRIGLEEFPQLAECFIFDDNGTVSAMASMEDMRGLIEAYWRSQASGVPITVERGLSAPE